MTDFPSNASNVCVECGDALSAESQSLEETKGSKVVSVMKVTWNCDCFNSEVEVCSSVVYKSPPGFQTLHCTTECESSD